MLQTKLYISYILQCTEWTIASSAGNVHQFTCPRCVTYLFHLHREPLIVSRWSQVISQPLHNVAKLLPPRGCLCNSPARPSLLPSLPSPCRDGAGAVNNGGVKSKFCHSCGTRYPVDSAKFCCECGIRRMCLWRRASSIAGTGNKLLFKGGKKKQINIKRCANGGATAKLRSCAIIWVMSSVYRQEPECGRFFLFVGLRMSTFILTQNNLK